MNKIPTIALNQTVAQAEGNIVSNMGHEKVMLSISKGKYYNLGEIGGDIWELIKDPIPVREVVSKLMSIYEVEQTQCEEQVLAFLELLLEENLIVISKELKSN